MPFRTFSNLACLLLCAVLLGQSPTILGAQKRPNVLFAISDDQSWIHASAYGTSGVETPAFDRIAREGVLFQHAFTAAPSCSPSRAALLTGQHIWRLESAGNLLAVFPAKWPVFPLLLEDAGYEIGHTGKGWGPGRLEGWARHPIGRAFQDQKLEKARRGMSNIDYAANFEDFLAQRDPDKPFCFWFGSSEPHLGYDQGQGIRAGKELTDAHLFDFWPNSEVFQGDVLDYCVEIEHFDTHLGRMLSALEKAGELDNTLVIVTSDHGNPLARSKCNLYDGGVRVPLAIRLPGTIPGGRTLTDFASLVDVAPTILDAAGLNTPEMMTGSSLLPILSSRKSGRVDPARNHVVTAFERHTWCRPDGVGYPSRAIRTDDFLYIRNYEPSRWPAGDPDLDAKPQGPAGDIDLSPSKLFLMAERNSPDVNAYYDLAIGKRPGEELYSIKEDPDQMNNLAGHPEFETTLARLADRLAWFTRITGDPRQRGESPWDHYEYTGAKP